jgi:hypothetical protein
MNRSMSDGFMAPDPIASVLSDPGKRTAASQLLGQAYLTARCLMELNKDKVEAVADTLVERRELYGDEVTSLLDRQRLAKPEIEYTDESIWPKL